MACFVPSNPPSTRLGHLRQLSKRAGVHVSPLQLGGMSIGESAWTQMGMGQMTKESSFKLLDTFWEAGGNFIDTAGF
jgi:aryl-alcohol dehydrogenase-like predicted oxidoreductase